MKTYGGVDVVIHVFLTSALVGEWSASRPGRFTTGTDYIGGWVGGKAGLDSNSDPSAIQPIASCYTNCTISVQCYCKFYDIKIIYEHIAKFHQ
jgi:hypothetical protein